MFDLKNIKRGIDQIAEEKGLDPKKVLEVIEASIAAAYKKEYGKKGEIIRAKFDLDTGDLRFWKVKTVVDKTTVRIVSEEEKEAEVKKGVKKGSKSEEKQGSSLAENAEEEEKLPRYNPDRHIFLEDAKKEKPDAKVGDEIMFPLETHDDFGRIAAQTAKQVIIQRIREAERESILNEYKNKEGEIVSGIVQRFERGNVFVDLGRATGVMFYNESIPGEHYRVGERLRFYILAVQEERGKTPGIILSRSHPKFVSKLFAMEVPEIGDGIIEIKAIAREPGSRTKIAVSSNAEGVDPVGALVGQRGTRVMAVSNELGNEKIDVVEWSEDPAKLIANSLSPARVTSVEILPRREARVFVPQDQLSLAIGRGGQNVRLAAKLTNWKIDVRSQTNPDEMQASGVATAEGEIAPEAAEIDASSASDEPEEPSRQNDNNT